MGKTHPAYKAIQSWLLGPDVQFADGPNRGGIVGWLDERGSAVFLYPEIMGYYLTWLAFLSHAFGPADEVARHANETLRWISGQLASGGAPPTRKYLTYNETCDWRNSGSFAFDLAMLARGVAAVRNLANECERVQLLEKLLDRLLPFCTECRSFQAFRSDSQFLSEEPPRWSCIQGPYQAKVATAVLSTNTISPIPSQLHLTAAAVYSRWREYSRQNTLEGDHPAFYHLEGLALAGANGWDPDAWPVAKDAYLQIIGMQSPAARMAPYFNGSASENRSDVLAQALRMGCILRSRAGLDSPVFDRKLQHLAEVLQQFVTDDGAVLFSLSPPYRHKNVWSSMFAHQALCFYEVVNGGNSLEDRWLQLLV